MHIFRASLKSLFFAEAEKTFVTRQTRERGGGGGYAVCDTGSKQAGRSWRERGQFPPKSHPENECPSYHSAQDKERGKRLFYSNMPVGLAVRSRSVDDTRIKKK